MNRLFSPARHAVLTMLSLVLSVLSAGQAAAVTEEQHAAMAVSGLEQHIQPGFRALAGAAEAQQKTLAGYCLDAAKGDRRAAEAAFRDTVLAFARIEHLRFGPLAEDGRLERFLFWPDRKGIGAKQVAAILKKHDRAVTNAQDLAGKSAAVQGLGALEQVLYGGDWGKAEDARFRCAYAQAIAGNLAALARELAAGWSDDSAYVKLWRKPDEDSEVFVNHAEVSRTLFISFLTGLKLIKDFKLAQPMGESLAKARPRNAALWRSGLSSNVLKANVEGTRELFLKVFAAPVDADNPGADEGVDLDFRQMLFDMTRLTKPLGEAAADEKERPLLEQLRQTVTKIQKEGGGAAAKATDQLLGFNSLDGD